MERSEVEEILGRNIHPLWRRVNARFQERITSDFMEWSLSPDLEKKEGEAGIMEMLVHFLAAGIDGQRKTIDRLQGLQLEFTRRYSRAETDSDRKIMILDFAGALGAGTQKLAGDKKAFSRWFGHDAVMDRCRRQVAEKEREMTFFLNRLGVVGAAFLGDYGPSGGYRRLWRRLNIERTIRPLLTYEGDTRVTVEALRVLTATISTLPEEIMGEAVEVGTVHYIYRTSLERRRSIWLQIASLRLLEHIYPSSLHAVLSKHLGQPVPDRDHLFLRRRSVLAMGKNLERLPELQNLIPIALSDKSPYVRQTLTQALVSAPAEILLPVMRELVLADDVPQVRASVLVEMTHLVKRKELREGIMDMLANTLLYDHDLFVIRTGLGVAAQGLSVLLDDCGGDGAEEWYNHTVSVIETLHRDAASLQVRRWAAQARERMWCSHDTQARALMESLRKDLEGIRPGTCKRFPAFRERYNEETTGRVLSVLAQNEYGFEVQSGMMGRTIQRGHVFRFRLWRLLHELKTPSPEKRQAFSHTLGRVFKGTLHAPSAILAELTETMVPGEPLFMESEAGWRPYLPLMDEALSLLVERTGPLRIYTSEGVTEISPPRNPVDIFKAWLLITLRFAQYAHLRNWKEQTHRSPGSYVAALRKLGFTVHFRSHRSMSGEPMEDSSVTRFFPAALPFADQNIWARIQDYFFSVYENSLEHLLVFAAIIAVLFFGQKLYKNLKMGRARKRFPVVIGGWGTRGKSGTERMKAALINALGFGFVSKTTGCEAMLLQAHPYDTMRDLFLFRPYDKATIWEQQSVVEFADKLGAEFMLWECMALQPSYVRVLQRHWLRDDISTITNAYPDHEDHQGPAGINIPEVMTNFIPESAVLITTEDLMRPILSQAAREINTRVRTAGWLEAGLITRDILDRFPYEEHPSNVSLVLELADELGVDRDYALKEIADRVMPDIGVLKVFPAAPVEGRRLQFVNGMSANDQFGCLNNWTRTGFSSQDYIAETGVWITTVVNNRADRIARSRVFAGILVEQLMADRHFLIGSNLKGMMGYIREAWEEHMQQLTLKPVEGMDAAAYLEDTARRFRMPIAMEHIMNRLRAALNGLGIEISPDDATTCIEKPEGLRNTLEGSGNAAHADDLIKFVIQERDALDIYLSLKEKLESTQRKDMEKLDKEFHEMLTRWFMSKFVVIDDFHASGEQIVNRIKDETPPGFLNRIMGIQNIKGTGLDFVYRWQAWERCWNACSRVREGSAQEMDAAVKELSTFQDFGFLSEEWVRETLNIVKHMQIFQAERIQAELSVILSNLNAQMDKVREGLNIAKKEGVLRHIGEAVEAFLDAGESRRRRRKADRIYQDIVDERIGHERAIFELQQLNKQQKGGWLTARLARMGMIFTR